MMPAEYHDLAWQVDAACADHPGVDFFPTRGQSMVAAKAICADCSVRAECLAYAVDTGQHFGIWGGLSDRQRKRMRPPRPSATCGTTAGYARHINHHEPTCEACRAAINEYQRQRREATP